MGLRSQHLGFPHELKTLPAEEVHTKLRSLPILLMHSPAQVVAVIDIDCSTENGFDETDEEGLG